MPQPPPTAALTRAERKQKTRRALMDGALELLETRSFDSLGLREVTRSAGIAPAAFYRHFESMEQLGLALIDESFEEMRAMLREARLNPERFERVIRASVEILVRHVRARRSHFSFIVRERFSGIPVLRDRIRGEIRLISSELATDLSRFPGLGGWPTADLQLLAGVLVNTMVVAVEEIVLTPAEQAPREETELATAERQLLLIALGSTVWRPR